MDENNNELEILSNYAGNQCPYKGCGKFFKFKNNLVHHKKIHTGQKDFTCDYCTKRFITKGNKLSHERSHQIQKTFLCKKCGVHMTKNTNNK